VTYAPITGEGQDNLIASILANPAPYTGEIYTFLGAEELTNIKLQKWRLKSLAESLLTLL